MFAQTKSLTPKLPVTCAQSQWRAEGCFNPGEAVEEAFMNCMQNDEGCITYNSGPTTIYPQPATWIEQLKDGHYIATFDDPNNKWRCHVVGTDDMIPIGGIIISCVDTTQSTVPPPPTEIITEGIKRIR